MFLIFFIILLIALSSCAKKIQGAGSASIAPSVSEVLLTFQPEVQVLGETQEQDREEKIEDKRGLRIGIGVSNLRPYLVGVYVSEESAFGLGLGGIIFSGFQKSYDVLTGDLSFLTRWLKGKNSFLGLGIGVGGSIAQDENWSRLGKKTNLFEAHFYGQLHLGVRPPGSGIGVALDFKIGGFYIASPVFVDISQELKQQTGNEYIRERDNIRGLSFTPSFGINWSMVDGKVLSYLGFTLPLTTFLIFEPDFHPYIPSLNFIMVF